MNIPNQLADGRYTTKPKWHQKARERVVVVKDGCVKLETDPKYTFTLEQFFSANDLVAKVQ